MGDRSKYLGQVPESHEDTVHELLANELYDDSPPEGVDNKYWDQRYRLFSRFQQIDFTTGEHSQIQLDEESWYSVTPECIADYITECCVGSWPCIIGDGDDETHHQYTEGGKLVGG